ncbi:pollen-specific leucine-rich repeat extensin-like protein 1 [Lingula anatina]|uniref:Pollen-specific leucine-rich repeat extensin-like protein 1 n=1 Tax=Lingula anatina TaxID=7574 RepID=A0A1S3ITQ8_LINAN|nr:pollen-specific leucine-rich repeat extensin-like protein 1 [Lingula anatina]|eukprot:XP_013401582.1 pollen-specific leucine-rich repeat extensin-like protein 1 [Lingula anatina]
MPPPPPPPRPPKPGEKPAIGHSNKPPPVPAKNAEPTEDYEVPENPHMQNKDIPPPLPPNHPKPSHGQDSSDDEYETPQTDSGGSLHEIKPKITAKSPLPPLPKEAKSPQGLTKPKPKPAEKKVPPVPSFKPQPVTNKPAIVPKPQAINRTKNTQNKIPIPKETENDSKDISLAKEKAGGIAARIAALQKNAGAADVPVPVPGKLPKPKPSSNSVSTGVSRTQSNADESSSSSPVSKRSQSPETVEKKQHKPPKGGAKALPPIPKAEEPEDTPPPPPSVATIPHKKDRTPIASKSPSFNPGSRPLPPPPGGSQSMDEENIEAESWYHGDISRDVSDQRLKSLGTNGSFLVRLSKKGGPTSPYSLSLFHEGRVWNLHIRKKADASFALGNEKPNELSFPSVSELISYHQTNPLVLAGAQSGQTQLRNTPDKS